jgi:type I restriction enzyme S subunit
VIRLQNIGPLRFLDDRAYIGVDHFAKLIGHSIEPNDLLIAGLGEQLPRACLAPATLGPAIVKADCFRVRLHRDVSPAYVCAILNSPQVRSAASQRISGVGRPRLNLQKVRQIQLPIPPRPEQERIVAAVEEQFSRIEVGDVALERVRHNLKRMRASVLQEAVGGQLGQHDISHWQHISLGDALIDIQAGKSFKCEERPARLDEWGVIKVSAMTWGDFRQHENKTVLPGREIDGRMEIREGDLLVSRANTVEYVGAVVLVGPCRSQLLLSDKSLRLIPCAGVLPQWLLIVLRSHRSRKFIERVATGTSDSMRNISQPKLKALRFPLPPVAVQQSIVESVERQLSALDQMSMDLGKLQMMAKHLRSAILADAFAGKLVSQHLADESASSLLGRIAAERVFNGHRPEVLRAQRTKATR